MDVIYASSRMDVMKMMHMVQKKIPKAGHRNLKKKKTQIFREKTRAAIGMTMISLKLLMTSRVFYLLKSTDEIFTILYDFK